MPGPRDYLAGTQAALFALSGKTCYFPECPTQVVVFVEGIPIINVQIAHIRGANKNGQRYEESMSDDERRSWPNVLLLCKPHHDLVDRIQPDNYSPDTLKSWKADREGVDARELGALSRMTEDELAELIEGAVRKVDPQREVIAEFDLGYRTQTGVLTIPHESFTPYFVNNRDIGPAILIVTTRNKGTLDAFVTSISLLSNPSGASLLSINDFPDYNRPMTFKIEAGEAVPWMFHIRNAFMLDATNTFRGGKTESLTARVVLGSGETIMSNDLPWSSVPDRSLFI